jgi:alkane 1-monooxygenase
LTLLVWAGFVAVWGVSILAFVIPAALWANFQLTSANYVEHYGLLRQTAPDGRVEPCGPEHSWNSNHRFSNWATFHLQRHADHHAHPRRRYQALRHVEQAPQLPSGYFAMFTLAYLPALWFRVMDPLLVRQVHADPSKVNFDPSRRDDLLREYFS